jgi:hypothetical protein
VRFFKPGVVVFCVALLASLCVHFPVYTALGVLADALLHEVPAQKPQTVEFELAALDDAADEKEEPEELAQPAPQPSLKATAKPPKPEEKPKTREAKVEAPKPKPVIPVPALATPPPPPEPKIENKLAVTQKSEDPSVPPPDNARFVADENRRVEQETVASQRNLVVDEPNPTAAPREVESETTGAAADDLVAETQNVDGERERAPKAVDIERKPTEDSALGQGEREAPAVAKPSSAGQSSAEEKAQREVAAGAPKTGGEPETDTVVIEDGMGRIRVRRAPQGAGPGDQGGLAIRGMGTESRADSRGSRAREGSDSPNLAMSFSRFEQTFGAEELRAQREAYLEQRRSRTRGGSHTRDWQKFRAAIENFVPNVKSGAQTALNAAASPFAAYLADIHRTIHREFAMRFLQSLPLVSDGPYNDY